MQRDEKPLELLKKNLESIFVCHHIVDSFNDALVRYLADTRYLLNFVHCFIYEVQKRGSENVNDSTIFYEVENYIPGQYEKYNNNAGWTSTSLSETSAVSQALSHYSWQLTHGYLLIVDLQGVAGVLTDPQIHCLDEKRFGSGNLGYEGILKFFYTHRCNQYCEALRLVHPSGVVG